MKRYVIDANVAAKWFLPEADSALAERILTLEAELHAPEFLATEFASIIWKHSMAGTVTSGLWLTARDELRTAIGYWHSQEKLLEPALELAVASRHHVFDCLYLALAEMIDGRVITADKQFLARFSGTRFADRVIPMQVALA